MKQKLGTTALRSLRVGCATKACGCVQLVGLALLASPSLLPRPLSPFGPPAVEEPRRQPLGASTHDPQNGPLHRKPPSCPSLQGSKREGKENLACPKSAFPLLPRFPRLGLSDLTTRLSTQGGDRCQVDCVRSSSCVPITATSEIPLCLCLTPLPLAQKWVQRTLENSRIFMPCCP